MITQLINNGRHSVTGTTLPAQWQEFLFLLWAIGLFAAPVYFLGGIEASLPIERYIDPRAHTVVESFCGIVALLIAGMIFTLAWQRHEWVLTVFGLGFLSMGGLDLVHAFVHPFDFPERFVMFHTLSVLSGGVILCAGVLFYYRRHAPQPPASLWSKELWLLLGIVITAAVLHSFYLPHRLEADIYEFQLLAHRVHDVASALYAITALAFFLHYRMQRHTLSLVVAGMLLLFAESAFLFRFSHLWDSVWWSWHAVKIIFYFGTLVVIVAALVIVLRVVEASRCTIVDTNRELRKAHAALERANYELQVRNRMANDAIRSTGLNDTLRAVGCALGKLLSVTHSELILKVAADEVDEYQQLVDREHFDWNIVAAASAPAHTCLPDPRTTQDSDVMYHCAMPNGQPGACICFRLQANGAEFGYLRLFLESAADLGLNQDQLLALSAEVGSILHSAFLNHHWTDATRFRTALLRVASLMGSTLELERVLETVCKESAHLLDSDGAFVWLAEGPDRRLTMASKCVLGGANNAVVAQYAHSMGEALGRRLLARAGSGLEPVAMLRGNCSAEEEADLTLRGCEWGALAMFPLTDGAKLNGVMVLLRKHKVRYSEATLEKGELLARQVRLAINNACAYEQLQKVNAQLREAEEQKLQAERLAALGQMAATVAHEVGNPLSAIANCLAVMKKDMGYQPNTATALEIMDEEVQRLQRLTRNFLNFGHPHLATKKYVRPDEIVSNVYLAVQRHVMQEGLPIRLEQRSRGTAQPVQLDGDGFREVVWNLLLNAVQAIDGPGSVTVEVRVRQRHLFLMVADTGRGIPYAERNRIFDPFYTTRSCGAGLGLAVVHQFVEMWHGRLRVWSAIGCGTRFHLLLPIEQGLTVEI